MTKKSILTVIAALLLCGCATTVPKGQPLVTQLQLRVGELERQLDQKDERIKNLEYGIKDLSYEVDKLKAKPRARTSSRTAVKKKISAVKNDERIIRVSVSEQQVQRALKKAGYYTGAIDGKVGSGTKKAISNFQQDNGLKADGIIGQQTWDALQDFLE